MKKAEAERLIVAEMRQRLPRVPYDGAGGGYLQYSQLKKERPELFAFKHAAGDDWQIVSGWLHKHGLVR